MDLKHLWMQTYTGLQFRPYAPHPDQIDITDIAHALSMQCRYCGHTNQFYSVAQHSVLTSLIVPQEFAFCALMHDAVEAYISDVPSPAKRGLREFNELEDSIWKKAIAPRFGLPLELPPEVKLADYQMLVIEKRDLLTEYGHEWQLDCEAPDMPRINPLMPHSARDLFINRFHELRGNR